MSEIRLARCRFILMLTIRRIDCISANWHYNALFVTLLNKKCTIVQPLELYEKLKEKEFCYVLDCLMRIRWYISLEV